MLRLIASLALLALAACTPPATRPPAEAAPLFALAPSALPGGLAEQQRLAFEHGDRRETVDAMVQADADAVRLVIHAQGQVALRLDWDGEQLTQKRMPWVPESLDGARVLSDLQLVFWPAEALRTQLPAGWTLDEDGARRTLRDANGPVAWVDREDADTRVLHQARLRYRLRIDSVPVSP
ncbi:DUF3261 domain-containing protein [Arenimonas metalli]|uniref:DUF3261 domain-containing protein n=1 Tax=Arenimonas metalli CF5-1 TaxID=1384056 RepID=A0A091B6I8_9GAMM|nr:DUF3261 domain-containing protein [Arenimonas metalli]KFN47112.1 hypothetical protein N787_02065 [Arenimonas metalli CF5-1]